MSFMYDILARVEKEVPVHSVAVASGRVWCDESSIAIAAVLEINGTIVEDCSVLTKKSDVLHIMKCR